MRVTNFDIFQMAIRSSDLPDRAEIERSFIERYRRATETAGSETAEALARSETLSLLHRLNLDPEGAAYLRSHLQ